MNTIVSKPYIFYTLLEIRSIFVTIQELSVIKGFKIKG